MVVYGGNPGTKSGLQAIRKKSFPPYLRAALFGPIFLDASEPAAD